MAFSNEKYIEKIPWFQRKLHYNEIATYQNKNILQGQNTRKRQVYRKYIPRSQNINISQRHNILSKDKFIAKHTTFSSVIYYENLLHSQKKI